ncbi:uncharacterized protein LOC144197261 isoform X2 [Stigmatopora nigra]
MHRIRSSPSTDCGETSRMLPNGQKGSPCRRHTELFLSKWFKARETMEDMTKQEETVKIDKEVQAEFVDEVRPKCFRVRPSLPNQR